MSSVAITVCDSVNPATVPNFVRARLKIGTFDTAVWQPALTQGEWIKVTAGSTQLALANFSTTGDNCSACVLWGIDG